MFNVISIKQAFAGHAKQAAQLAASSAACFAWPANACFTEMTLNMRAQPASCTQTPLTPPRPARSTSSQIMPAFITHLEYEKSDGGTIGQARPRIGSWRG